MSDLGPGSYGDAFADVYDRWYPDVTDASACVERLVELAGPAGEGTDAAPRRVLELGVGTGRLALPLSARGLDVTGLDASAAMLERLSAKPGAGRIHAVLADMARLDEAGLATGYALVLIAYNTLFNLPDEAAQRSCIEGAAALLAPGGRLVVEAFVPDDEPDATDADASASARRDDLSVRHIDPGEVVMTATLHDPAAQTITGQHIQITEHGTRLRPWRVRYLRPGQLDEMARAAGLVPAGRWSDWNGSPFDDDSAVHVSAYLR